jgi:cyclophilin family peptidyl-prolyl cis-trans isomerase/HEAT repeat protein
MRRHRIALCLLLALHGVSARLAAQSEAAVEQLAPILKAEDTRLYDPGLFQRAMAQPDPLVRKIALRAIGRIRDTQGQPLLIAALRDRDSTLVAEAAFALGQMADSTTFSALNARLADNTFLLPSAVNEIVTAMVKIGGPQAGTVCAELLQSIGFGTDSVRSRTAAQSCLRESWRLGQYAPLDQLRTFLNSSDDVLRTTAFYVLGRLHRPADATRMLAGLRETNRFARAASARALTQPYADSAHLDPATVTRQLGQLAADNDPTLRIQSLRSLGTYRGERIAPMLLPGLADQVPNVAVTAAEALGNSGDSSGVPALLGVLDGKGPFALRRAALISLAQLDAAALATRIKGWTGSADWRDRATAATAWGAVKPFDPSSLTALLADPDSRVAGAALQSWSDATTGPDPRLLSTARQLLGSRDPVIRSVAADAVARAADPADVPSLVRALAAAQRDSIPDAALSALNAIRAINASGEPGHRAAVSGFLETAPRPREYLLRRWAADHWPELADRWVPIEPVETARSLQDYRDAAQTFLAVEGPLQRPHVIIETAKGKIELELAGPDAPLTVANFLRLVDRHYFDNQRWHRVVPDFVAQAGDPRGDGWGGPGWTIRDEVNPVRYESYTVGMALSGPETGGSQFFITLSPAPHLNGIYTVFGKVVNGAGILLRLSQGELITSIHR